MNARKIAIAGGFVLLAGTPAYAWLFDKPFPLDLFTSMMVFAIAASSLDLILGYGGLPSFGHAAYLGVGAYSVGILSFYGINNGVVHLTVAVAASALIALFIGAVSLRTTGAAFVMITLAFAQMLYFLAISVNVYGGGDGMSISGHSEFFGLINLDSATQLYYLVFAILLLFF